jgi:hypothetical protein
MPARVTGEDVHRFVGEGLIQDGLPLRQMEDRAIGVPLYISLPFTDVDNRVYVYADSHESPGPCRLRSASRDLPARVSRQHLTEE